MSKGIKQWRTQNKSVAILEPTHNTMDNNNNYDLSLIVYDFFSLPFSFDLRKFLFFCEKKLLKPGRHFMIFNDLDQILCLCLLLLLQCMFCVYNIIILMIMINCHYHHHTYYHIEIEPNVFFSSANESFYYSTY